MCSGRKGTARLAKLEREEMSRGDTKQALGGSCLATSSTVHSLAKRKSVPRSTGKALDLSPFAFSPMLFSTAGTDQDLTDFLSTRANPNWELELMVP